MNSTIGIFLILLLFAVIAIVITGLIIEASYQNICEEFGYDDADWLLFGEYGNNTALCTKTITVPVMDLIRDANE